MIILGNTTLTRSAGYWSTNYEGTGTKEFSNATLLCYLAISRHMSQVFDEDRALSTLQDARDVISTKSNKGSMREILDRQLLAVWLNFANGSIGYSELLDTDGDLILATPFYVVLAAAEAVRLDPLATDSQLEQQKVILEQINLRDSNAD